MRPEMGREQFAQVAVGTPAREEGFSQGRRVLDGENLGGEDLDGRGRGRVAGAGEAKVIVRGFGSGTEVVIAELAVSSGRLMVGTDDVSSQDTHIEGSPTSCSLSGKLILGTAGAEAVMAGMLELSLIRLGSTS